MFEHKKVGDVEMTVQVEMPESTKEILTEILAQNRMLLEANCTIMRLICNQVVSESTNNIPPPPPPPPPPKRSIKEGE